MQSACPAIGGLVYYDIDDDGIHEDGEPGIGGVPIQLKDAAGATVAITTTAPDGFYRFDRARASTQPVRTLTHVATVPSQATDWAAAPSVPAFDVSLGTLDAVEITLAAAITSGVQAESLDTAPQAIAAEVSGSVTLSARGVELAAAPLSSAGTFDAGAYDGVTDFAGTSGHDFGSVTATDSATTTVSDAVSLGAWSSGEAVKLSVAARATSRTTGSGNVVNTITTAASAEVTVTYRYLPVGCLDPGSYTIIEVSQPAPYSDGLDTAGNRAPLPGSRGSDAIPVTLGDVDLPANNFGELAPSLHGCVFIDRNRDGAAGGNEPGVPGVTVELSGAHAATTVTGNDGCYSFVQLPEGSFAISVARPAGFSACAVIVGTQGGRVEAGRIVDIRIVATTIGRGNNFGLCGAAAATPTATPPVATGTPQSPPPAPATPSPTPAAGRGLVSSASPTPLPNAPTAGSGIFNRSPDVRIVIVGFAIFAASGWIAFLALGRARDREGR